MLVALWIINVLLVVAFGGAGLLKLARSKEQLAASGMAWTEDFTAAQVRLIGVAELVGAVGLIVPLLTGIAPSLTPIAAIALAILMIGASVVHVRRGEKPIPNVVLVLLATASAVLGFLVVLG